MSTLEDPIADKILSGKIKDGDTVNVDVQGKKLIIS